MIKLMFRSFKPNEFLLQLTEASRRTNCFAPFHRQTNVPHVCVNKLPEFNLLPGQLPKLLFVQSGRNAMSPCAPLQLFLLTFHLINIPNTQSTQK